MAKILIAEDDRGIQTLLSTILTREGFAVECVSDGAEAMRRLNARHYDVVLLDLMMPNLSGGDVIQLLEDQGHDALSRVIVITAAAMHEASVVDRLPILRKPFDIDELRGRVHAVAAARQQVAEGSSLVRQSPPAA
ncbi:MAG TPA: response regulator [Thermoanaerobaculia bacterium]|nr:response regulator [Thermoanaerobaculia bacterium]